MRLTLLAMLCVTSLISQSSTGIDQGILAQAQSGNPEAQYKLGFLYENQGSKGYMEAIKWYREAANQGHARAQFYLGLSYETGQMVPQDFSEAYVWYSLSAAFQSDNALAMQYRDKIAKKLSQRALESAQARAKKFHAELLTKKSKSGA